MGTEPGVRNLEHYPNNLLEDIIKICVGNSLVPLKVQMMKEQYRLKVTYKIPLVPLIEVTPITK